MASRRRIVNLDCLGPRVMPFESKGKNEITLTPHGNQFKEIRKGMVCIFRAKETNDGSVTIKFSNAEKTYKLFSEKGENLQPETLKADSFYEATYDGVKFILHSKFDKGTIDRDISNIKLSLGRKVPIEKFQSLESELKSLKETKEDKIIFSDEIDNSPIKVFTTRGAFKLKNWVSKTFTEEGNKYADREVHLKRAVDEKMGRHEFFDYTSSVNKKLREKVSNDSVSDDYESVWPDKVVSSKALGGVYKIATNALTKANELEKKSGGGGHELVELWSGSSYAVGSVFNLTEEHSHFRMLIVCGGTSSPTLSGTQSILLAETTKASVISAGRQFTISKTGPKQLKATEAFGGEWNERIIKVYGFIRV